MRCIFHPNWDMLLQTPESDGDVGRRVHRVPHEKMGNSQVSPRPSLGGYGLAAGCKLISTACEETLVCWQPGERRNQLCQACRCALHIKAVWSRLAVGFLSSRRLSAKGSGVARSLLLCRRSQPRDDELGRTQRAHTDGKEERDQWVRQDPRSWRWHRILGGGEFCL